MTVTLVCQLKIRGNANSSFVSLSGGALEAKENSRGPGLDPVLFVPSV